MSKHCIAQSLHVIPSSCVLMHAPTSSSRPTRHNVSANAVDMEAIKSQEKTKQQGGMATSSNVELSKLNSICSLFVPSDTSSITNHDPTTIIICQWMGASPKSRYLRSFYEKYHERYPNARIISIRSLPEYFIYVSNHRRLAALDVAVAAVESDPAPQQRILVHAFSNGGSLSFADLSLLYKEKLGKSLSIKGVVFDSAPGDPGLKEGWAALSIGLPKAIWYPMALLVWLLLLSSWSMQNIVGRPNIIRRMRRWLLDPSLISSTAPRLYVYSDTDLLVGASDVERHANDAEAAGVRVLRRKVTNSKHIQHALADPEKYWASVLQLWKHAAAP